MELERRKAEGEEAVQKVLAQSAEEGRQLQSSVQALRDQLEREKARHSEEEQLIRRTHRDETADLEKTIQRIRGELEVGRGKK
jgi:HAMP domain-containing protein